ncbi:MAG: hypothetical protein UV63_C0008G0013 [Microgenomates group bacterium GW2011_GWC1_43_11]|uniref:Mannosyl-glycoprotein endo-beta-N-acetylglucosamidase-like domain-containing protein n=2 Tax=Candidatus Gottesmaniibacteriota TaxID=1752720 RepID=A0A0G1LNP3_9BACT|nr:MAG: hypothetical protein UV63_C0008G0013 [Microgenomates group bacterium GW2011_GWC1_43_11]KKT39047.1 MAG: hypothetical protein UW22_C0002G0023 [Candidatus Gottesmanbacteria bacterium GW2011_GWB1_44_11c]KKT61509.1 MAG: hypothetical protein UW52_C0002G0023 [Candidatus Gottesmanbacteria bacterium GW2011_GWA1_44_24b]HCM81907.1 hypothetical protein [Patescibacteria group bacterium]
MKRLLQVFFCLTISAGILRPLSVFASDQIKQTYQTAELAWEIRNGNIDNRSERLKKYLRAISSPMADAADHFVKEADRLGLDWKLVAAISGNESYFGWYIPDNSYNGWGWAVWTGTNYGACFGNWEEGITAVSEGLKADYIDQGLTTVEAIGQKYAADPEWSWKVNHFMEEIEAFNPYKGEEPFLALSL